jgi:hypothetical protein
MIGKIAGLFLTAALAFGQTDRTFHFEHTGSPRDMHEIATAIRAIAGISQMSTDDAKQTLTLGGTAEQLGLAEWMFNELDAPNPQSEAVRQYKMQSVAPVRYANAEYIEDTVRIFYLNYAPTIQDFQEVATAVRTVGDIRRVFTYNAPHAMIVRGSSDQIGLAAWMVEQLNRPPAQQTVAAEYRMPVTDDRFGEVVTRVMYVSNAQTTQEFQEIATAVRTVANIRRVFTYNRPRAMIVRSDAPAVALAQWLLTQLDKPAAADAAIQSSAPYEYDTPYDPDNMIRVFYTPQFATVHDFQQFATQVRTTAGLRRVFTYNEPRAMAVRGTIDQVATAERMVNALKPQ